MAENTRKRKSNDDEKSEYGEKQNSKDCRARGTTKLNYVKDEKENNLKYVSATAPSRFPIKEFFSHWFGQLYQADTADHKMSED
jgi:hypothetical protein